MRIDVVDPLRLDLGLAQSPPHGQYGAFTLRRRGHVEGQEPRGNALAITARVPLSEMFGYATDLRSNTQGRATYTMQFDSYQAVPDSIAQEIIARVRGE